MAGAIHHVYARGVRRLPVFRDDLDRLKYLEMLARVVERQRWRLLAYCLLGNHMHLLIETPEPNLGDGMRRLHGGYGRWFNDRHAFTGHVFEKRYGSDLVRDDDHLFALVRYIANNPVKAGLCADASEWPWGSYASTVDGTAPPWIAKQRLLELVGGWSREPVRGLELLVSAHLDGYFGGSEAA